LYDFCKRPGWTQTGGDVAGQFDNPQTAAGDMSLEFHSEGEASSIDYPDRSRDDSSASNVNAHETEQTSVKSLEHETGGSEADAAMQTVIEMMTGNNQGMTVARADSPSSERSDTHGQVTNGISTHLSGTAVGGSSSTLTDVAIGPISITRYRDIDRQAVHLTISYDRLCIQYRAHNTSTSN